MLAQHIFVLKLRLFIGHLLATAIPTNSHIQLLKLRAQIANNFISLNVYFGLLSHIFFEIFLGLVYHQFTADT